MSSKAISNNPPLFSFISIFNELENYKGWGKNFFSKLFFIIAFPFLWVGFLIVGIWATYIIGKFKKELASSPIADEKDYDKLKKIYNLISRGLGWKRTHPINNLSLPIRVLFFPLIIFIKNLEQIHFILSKKLYLIPPNATLEQVEAAAKFNEESGLKDRLDDDDDDDFYSKALALGKIKFVGQ